MKKLFVLTALAGLAAFQVGCGQEEKKGPVTPASAGPGGTAVAPMGAMQGDKKDGEAKKDGDAAAEGDKKDEAAPADGDKKDDAEPKKEE